MKQIILDFPKQFKQGIESANDIKVSGKFNNIILCGIGGSALPGNVLTIIENLPIPFYIHRDYELPRFANKNSLIICISFSGNTEETISAYEKAKEIGCQILSITTGGNLAELANQNNSPLVLVPNNGIQPRCATGLLVATLLKTLANSGIINDPTNELLDLAISLNPETFEAQGKVLAKKLVDKIPVVYASNQFKYLARIWKIKFNENSKIMAFWNYFPELNHNEMVGLTNIKSQIANCKYYFIILKDKDDHPRILKRMQLTADLIREAGADVDFIEIAGKTKLEKIFNCLLLGDWVSYYLALAYNINPEPVKIVEEFKKRMAT